MGRLQRILEDLRNGDYRTTLHARQRMAQRNISHADIQSCGETGEAVEQNDGKVRVNGVDMDGDELSIICAQEDGVTVITVF